MTSPSAAHTFLWGCDGDFREGTILQPTQATMVSPSFEAVRTSCAASPVCPQHLESNPAGPSNPAPGHPLSHMRCLEQQGGQEASKLCCWPEVVGWEDQRLWGIFPLLLQGIGEKICQDVVMRWSQPRWVMEPSPKIHHCLGLESPAGARRLTVDL